ncbi:RNA polymerase sigma factor [Methylosinus sp. H3A]|uniref:RNA polymerase sigma factor n=1 Tax=Methylosinus sp. H3A TaxID=2785786 RepID=UPI0018C25C5C|nr:RNA polymerase sigma factor [Methylosinus sp. H3A]MBG0810557.1 RNA polymerase sigma factor [Methylosinus sp. H3A]
MSDEKSRFFGRLFLRSRRELIAYFSRRVGREDASDLLQETFVRALRSDRFEAVADPPSLLQRIAVNLARDHARRRRTEAKYVDLGADAEQAVATGASPDARLEAEEKWRLLCEAVDGLPPRCRDVFLLYMREGLGLGEIAERLGISRNMAQKHMRLAMARCWAALE